jgi:uncharacterized MAPEG superfamily protein
MFLRFLTWLIVIVFVYRFFKNALAGFFGGYSNNSRMRQMQDQLNDLNKKVNDRKQQERVERKGDYIDYEDMK